MDSACHYSLSPLNIISGESLSNNNRNVARLQRQLKNMPNNCSGQSNTGDSCKYSSFDYKFGEFFLNGFHGNFEKKMLWAPFDKKKK